MVKILCFKIINLNIVIIDIYLLLQSFLFIKNLLPCGTTKLETPIASKMLRIFFRFCISPTNLDSTRKFKHNPETKQVKNLQTLQISANGATSQQQRVSSNLNQSLERKRCKM
ncbi:hypothetical protein GLYMA_14G204800v4 [Glycine max]|uniref:Uncharacterized protein n=1 Tax=Glycine max TaxID=3847 RepID=A0A0R0GFJ3_SOYBN|nr:hypothetical protein GYH30_040669 [Glycine max]KRH17194.1 hypothetical protein GLYMA_14G204800v4 [Glycine max]